MSNFLKSSKGWQVFVSLFSIKNQLNDLNFFRQPNAGNYTDKTDKYAQKQIQ